jgi:hypothetical protein
MTFKTGAAGIESDDFFDSNPGSHWSLVDVQGNGSIAHEGGGTSDAWMVLSRDDTEANTISAFTQINYLQDASNSDFTIQTKQETDIPDSDDGDEGGLWVQDASGDNCIILGRYHSSSSQRHVYAGWRDSGSWSYGGTVEWDPSMPCYLRIGRITDSWQFDYSINGSDWSDLDTHSKPSFTVAKVGFYIANYGNNQANWGVKWDYFMEMNSGEITPEDGGAPVRRVMVRG